MLPDYFITQIASPTASTPIQLSVVAITFAFSTRVLLSSGQIFEAIEKLYLANRLPEDFIHPETEPIVEKSELELGALVSQAKFIEWPKPFPHHKILRLVRRAWEVEYDKFDGRYYHTARLAWVMIPVTQ